jgi:hypothetical protein
MNENEMIKRDFDKPQKSELIAVVKEVGGEGSRVIEFIASTETIDRSGDIIDVAGWKLDNYLGSIAKGANPVFAWSHNYQDFPLGKAVSAVKDVREKKLRIRVKFPTIAEMCSDPAHPSEEALRSDTAYNMYKCGMLNAVSVGFKALKYKTRDDPAVLDRPEWQRGMHFLEQDLLELSAVLVPCNPDAVVAPDGIKGMLDAMKVNKSFNPEGIRVMEKIFAEEEDVDKKTLDDLNDRIKSLEDQIAGTTEKAGSKFSKETKKAIAEVTDALKASIKGVKACHDILAKMIEEPGEEESPEEDGKSASGETHKADESEPTVKDFSAASVDDVVKLFEEK